MKTKIISESEIGGAVSSLRQGGIVIYPTETVYALGCDWTNKGAKENIYKIKKRAKNKPLSVIVSSLSMIEKYAIIDKEAEKLIKEKMPGSFTVVVRLKEKCITNNKRKNKNKSRQETIAFRISSNKTADKIAKRLGRPIVATSANISGSGPIYRIKEIMRQFDGKVSVIVDAGDLPRRKVSAVYDSINKKVVRR